jgi:serine/threonine-protein kinase SRPK1
MRDAVVDRSVLQMVHSCISACGSVGVFLHYCLVSTAPKDKSDGKMTKNKKKKMKKKLKKQHELLEQQMLQMQEMEKEKVRIKFTVTMCSNDSRIEDKRQKLN